MEPRAGSARADEVNPLEITPEFDDVVGLEVEQHDLSLAGLEGDVDDDLASAI